VGKVTLKDELLATSDENRSVSFQGKVFMRNFKELKIWQRGFDIAVKSFRLTGDFPPNQKFGISSQITKSAVSIPSNIAEGSSRLSEKDYCRFIEISLGSSFELETQLLIAKAVNFGSVELAAEILKDVDEEQKMLISFIGKLNR
jgi:four helix bundle protein